MYLKKRSTKTELKSLQNNDKIQFGDVVEDLQAGERVKVTRSSFYRFLRGQKASQARELPQVYDVLRPQ